jgi:hypothetical protein
MSIKSIRSGPGSLSKKYWKVLLLLCFSFCFGINSYAQQGNTGAGKTDLLDSLIAISIILFILSVIVEKITQLVRKYSPFIKPQHTTLQKTPAARVWRNINRKQSGDDPEADKTVEREVNSLSFIIGLLIALAFRVDLFKMMKATDPRDVLFWDDKVSYTGLEMWLFVLSISLTGFFLTFGSKFFHDLLDTLFQVKNLKRKMSDENTYRAETIEQFDEYVEKTYTGIIEMAINQNRDKFSSPLIVSAPMHGKMYYNNRLADCIDVHVEGNDRGNIPFAVQVKMDKGQVVTVPVNVIFEVEKPTVLVMQGDPVAAQSSAQFKGTICCKLKRNADNKICLLTCSHVMTGGSGKNFFGTVDPAVSADVADEPGGSFIWALCNDRFDIALLEPGAQDFNYQFKPANVRTVTPSDIQSVKIKVVRQQGRGVNEGVIVNHRAPRPVTIQYNDGEYGMLNLLLLSNLTKNGDATVYTSLTTAGDSGACVFDENNHPIGMIVAGNSKFSYAIPMADILIKTNTVITI